MNNTINITNVSTSGGIIEIQPTAGEIDVDDTDKKAPIIGLSDIGNSGSVNFPSSISIDSKGRVTSLGTASENLEGLDSLNTTGLTVRSGSGTFTSRTITGSSNEINVTNGDGVSGDPTLSLPDVSTAGTTNFPSSIEIDSKGRVTSVGATSNNLSGLDSMTGTGYMVRTDAGTFANRQILSGSTQMSVENPTGISGSTVITFRGLLMTTAARQTSLTISTESSMASSAQTTLTGWTISGDGNFGWDGLGFTSLVPNPMTTGSFTIPADGVYQITLFVRWDSLAVAPNNVRAYIYRTSGMLRLLAADWRHVEAVTNSANEHLTCVFTGFLAQNDTIEFRVGQYSGEGGPDRDVTLARFSIVRFYTSF